MYKMANYAGLFSKQVALQVEEACKVPWLGEVILDFLEVHGLKEAVALVKGSGKRCVVCTPRHAPVNIAGVLVLMN